MWPIVKKCFHLYHCETLGTGCAFFFPLVFVFVAGCLLLVGICFALWNMFLLPFSVLFLCRWLVMNVLSH